MVTRQNNSWFVALLGGAHCSSIYCHPPPYPLSEYAYAYDYGKEGI